MCFTDDVQTLVERMEKLQQGLLKAQVAYDIGQVERFNEFIESLTPDLVYVTQCLLGVVLLKDKVNPVGVIIQDVDKVDLDALVHAFM